MSIVFPPAKFWNISEVLKVTTDRLTRDGFENARLNAERLLSQALNLNRVHLYLNFDRPLTDEELHRFRASLRRRLRKEPLQYILGETEFMSLPFKVSPAVLIPRPETEVLVQVIIDRVSKPSRVPKPGRFLSILDIGTGSGCIAVSLAKYVENVRVTALDISEDALSIARENARLNQVEDRVRFRKSDFLEEGIANPPGETFDVLVSNPPYVGAAEFESLPEEIRTFEPTVALKQGSGGLEFHRAILESAARYLNPGGLVALEVGLGQAAAVRKLCESIRLSKVESYRDLNGLERVVCAGLRKHDLAKSQGGLR